MRQEPQVTLASVVHETQETWAFFTAPAIDTVDETQLVEIGDQDFLVIRCLSPDKLVWGKDQDLNAHDQLYQDEGPHTHFPKTVIDPTGCYDWLLYSMFTKAGKSEQVDLSGNQKLKPVVNLLLEEGDIVSREIPASYYEGVIDLSITYDPTTQVYHLWYWINAWTSCTVQNKVGLNGELSPVATLAYDENDACDFDPHNWFVIPQRNMRLEDMPKAVRMLLHCRGSRYNLKQKGDSDTEVKPYLVTYKPEVVSYFPMVCVIETSEFLLSEEASSSSSSSGGFSISSISESSCSGCKLYGPKVSRSGPNNDHLRLPIFEITLKNNEIYCRPCGFDEIYICCDFL